jgi:hypothetical protein
MERLRIVYLLCIAAGLLSSCTWPATPAPPAITDTWIDAPEDGMTLQLSPYTIVFHSASVMGMDEFELRINGKLVTSVPPSSTASGGAQGTLFMADYEWHPPEPGLYQIEVKPKDQDGRYGPAAQVQVTVVSAIAQLEPAIPEQLPTLIPTLELAPTPTSTPTQPPAGFGAPEYSVEKVYYRGTGCGPKQVGIEVRAPQADTYSVVLFVRVEATDSGERTAWKAIPMAPLGDSYFGYSLAVERELPEVFAFGSAYLQAQFVATDSSGAEVGRTPVDSQVIVERCSS